MQKVSVSPQRFSDAHWCYYNPTSCLSRPMEARHYGMFFACSAWLLFLLPKNQQFHSKRHKTLYFIAHLALISTHYLGIVFSALTGIIRFWSQKEKGLKESMPLPEIVSCSVTIPFYLILLSTAIITSRALDKTQ